MSEYPCISTQLYCSAEGKGEGSFHFSHIFQLISNIIFQLISNIYIYINPFSMTCMQIFQVFETKAIILIHTHAKFLRMNNLSTFINGSPVFQLV